MNSEKVSKSILFVCLGNICRSPALGATLQKMVDAAGLSSHFFIDSCGIHSTFLNSKADPLMREAAQRRGIKIDSRSKVWDNGFFDTFDHIFVVDTRILEMLKSHAKSKKMAQKVTLATAFSPSYPNQPIPDPYMGGEEGFEKVMEMIVEACQGILNEMEKEL